MTNLLVGDQQVGVVDADGGPEGRKSPILMDSL